MDPNKRIWTIASAVFIVAAVFIVSLLRGQGMYTGEDKDVIYCVIMRREVSRLKRLVKLADPEAFMVITDVHEVLGHGFRRRVSA